MALKNKLSDELDNLHAEITTAAADVNRINTQEGKALANWVIRLVEILRHGEQKTAPPTRHHV